VASERRYPRGASLGYDVAEARSGAAPTRSPGRELMRLKDLRERPTTPAAGPMVGAEASP